MRAPHPPEGCRRWEEVGGDYQGHMCCSLGDPARGRQPQGHQLLLTMATPWEPPRCPLMGGQQNHPDPAHGDLARLRQGVQAALYAQMWRPRRRLARFVIKNWSVALSWEEPLNPGACPGEECLCCPGAPGTTPDCALR